MAGFKDSRYSYKATGLRVMHYSVTDKATGRELGTVYRDTGTTWAAVDLEGKQTIDHYPGSRDVAAGSLPKPAIHAYGSRAGLTMCGIHEQKLPVAYDGYKPPRRSIQAKDSAVNCATCLERLY